MNVFRTSQARQLPRPQQPEVVRPYTAHSRRGSFRRGRHHRTSWPCLLRQCGVVAVVLAVTVVAVVVMVVTVGAGEGGGGCHNLKGLRTADV